VVSLLQNKSIQKLQAAPDDAMRIFFEETEGEESSEMFVATGFKYF